MKQARILVIDDNVAVLRSLRLVLKDYFSTVVAVGEPNLIPAIIKDDNIDVVLLDMNFDAGRLDGQEGLFWLDYIKHRCGLANPPAVVLITAFGDVPLAVESLKRGADDFIQKPWNNDRLIEKIAEAAEKRKKKSASQPANGLTNQRVVAERSAENLVESSAHGLVDLKDIEREHIRKVIEQHDGNMTLAAKALGISRQTLYRKMKHHDLH